MRKSQLGRKTRMKRSGFIKRKPRPTVETVRIYGGEERVAWMKAMPCLACSRVPSEVAHVRSGGMGRKSDAALTVPLCHLDHATLHQMGVRSFETAFATPLSGLTLVDWAARYQTAWEAWSAA